VGTNMADIAIGGVRVVLHTAAIGQFLRSEPVYVYLHRLAEGISNSAGDGFAVKELRGSKRARVLVYTKTKAAKKAESEDRVLTRAVSSGRR
jgi:hypothetical protein